MLKTFQDCPKKYYLEYEKKIQIPQDISFSQTGKNLHSIINYYLKGFNTDKLSSALTKEEQALWENFLSLNITKDVTLESEYTFNIKTIQGFWLTGRIDAITKENEIYTIYDWKTGKTPSNPKEDLQTLIYLFALDKILKSKEGEEKSKILRFVYINLKKAESTDIFIQNELFDNIEGTISDIIKEIKDFSESVIFTDRVNLDKIFKNYTKNKKCSTCKFHSICKTDVFL